MSAHTPLSERIQKWIMADPNSGCWLWTGALDTNGYGITTDRKSLSAHRAAWEIECGPIPKGMHVLHKCDIRCCVNPNHLYLGTAKDNRRDAMLRKRAFLPDNRGERCSTSKLTAPDVLAIRVALKAGHRVTEIARQYGVNHSCISAIKAGTNWASLS